MNDEILVDDELTKFSLLEKHQSVNSMEGLRLCSDILSSKFNHYPVYERNGKLQPIPGKQMNLNGLADIFDYKIGHKGLYRPPQFYHLCFLVPFLWCNMKLD